MKRNCTKCEVNQFNFREAHLPSPSLIVVGLDKFCINKERAMDNNVSNNYVFEIHKSRGVLRQFRLKSIPLDFAGYLKVPVMRNVRIWSSFKTSGDFCKAELLLNKLLLKLVLGLITTKLQISKVVVCEFKDEKVPNIRGIWSNV
ncbi:hypothetical protein WN51_12303 [Melipona quadrifasciata]|uniref:Uncharacterized protein n=1 Tax=Melipona quadrifasciata TaxID=166423 RepID=A0A0M9ABS7_9HYME|nr:hypothetical protein WN51_12303 [Melipona quadrifasciata]